MICRLGLVLSVFLRISTCRTKNSVCVRARVCVCVGVWEWVCGCVGVWVWGCGGVGCGGVGVWGCGGVGVWGVGVWGCGVGVWGCGGVGVGVGVGSLTRRRRTI